jgi:xylulokinase
VAQRLAGVDVGTTNCKVGLYTVDGTPVVQRRRPTPADAEELVAGVLEDLRSCVEEAGAPLAIGVTGVAEGGVPLDADLRPLRPLLWWHDDRAGEQARWLARQVGRSALFGTTGVDVAAKTPLATWLWLRRHEPESLDRMRCWVSVPDLVATALAGSPLTDRTLAGRTGAFDQLAGRWDEDLLGLAGIDPTRLPELTAGRTTAGVPVVVAGHDHLVAAYAAGAREPGAAVDSLGTAEAVVTTAARPPGAAAAGTGMSWNRTADGRAWAMVSGFPHSGRLVEWLRSLTTGDYDRLDELAADVPRPTGIVVLPYLAGRAAPAPDPGRRLSVHGLGEGHALADVLVAVLEGACFHVRWMAERQAEHVGGELGAVTVLGGPSRGRALVDVKAHVMPGPTRLCTAPEAACVGAALLAGRALGLPTPVLDHTPLPRDDDLADRYDPIYRDFLSRAQEAA